MVRSMSGALVIVISTALLGCGSSQDSGCGSESSPIALTVADRSPAIDSTVANSKILHAFTVKDTSLVFSTISLGLLTPKHTAGSPTPNPLAWSGQISGKDLIYSTTVDAWDTAPGHVEIISLSKWKTDAGCHYELPSPLFSYDETP
jgi:hypothetical protein